MRSRLSAAVFLGIALLCPSAPVVSAQSDSPDEPVEINGSIHTPEQIMLLLIRSDLVYNIDLVADSVDLTDSIPEPYQGVSTFVRANDDGTRHMYRYDPDQKTIDAYLAADSLFEAEDYKEAIAGYRKVLELYPDYSQMYTWIGQSYRKLGTLDSALYYYQLAIERNFIDYTAHWFLGNLYWELTDTTYALKQLTIGHILNRHHVAMRDRLRELREQVGRPWHEWELKPEYELSTDRYTVSVRCDLDWLFYAVTKALWKYEPEYAKKMGASSNDSLVLDLSEEREALAVWAMSELSSAKSDSTEPPTEVALVWDCLTNGMTSPMILYEVMAVYYPTSMLLLPREMIDDMVTYVDTYH